MKSAGMLSVLMLGILAFAVALVALNGLMLSYLWQWFVVPLGVRAIGVPQAIGIAIIVSVLTYAGEPEKSENFDGLNKMLVKLAAKVVAFGIAFALSFMVPA